MHRLPAKRPPAARLRRSIEPYPLRIYQCREYDHANRPVSNPLGGWNDHLTGFSDVACWHKADLLKASPNVRFRSNANARILRIYSRFGRVVGWGTRRGPTA